MGEVHQFALLGVVFFPVTADRKHDPRRLVDGDDVGPRYAVGIGEGLRQVDVHVHLQERATGVVLVSLLLTSQLGVLLLDVRQVFLGIRQLDVAVEAHNLQLTDLVVRFLHHMREARADAEVRGTIRHHEVLSGDENRRRTLQNGVIIGLFEGRTRQRQPEQHQLQLVAILGHLLSDEVVHLVLDAVGLICLLRRQFTHDFSADRPAGGHQLAHCLRLEPHHGLCQHRVVHPGGPCPRLRAVLDLHTQQIKAGDVG